MTVIYSLRPYCHRWKNKDFITEWNWFKQSNEVELCGRIHSDTWNVGQHLILDIRLEIKFTKASSSSFLMNNDRNSKTFFKFLDVWLLDIRVKENPTIVLTHNATLTKDAFARYNLTRKGLKTFAFPRWAQSLSINNAVLGTVPKRLLYTMEKNINFLDLLNTNPCYFHHHNLSFFLLNVNGKQIPA